MLMQEDMNDYFVLHLAVVSIFLFSVYCQHFPFSLVNTVLFFFVTWLLFLLHVSFGDLFP